MRIEIESALSQKKRVIPVLVNDAKMPRAAELPESLKPFARCNAVRLSHERFRADMQGLIKALEEVLAEAEAARRAAEAEAERSRAAQVQRLRQSGGEWGERPREGPDFKAKGLVPWIAGLHSEIAWAIPGALVAITLLGWLFPGLVFVPVEQGGFGWGLLSLAYGAGGLIALGVLWRVRQPAMGGAELALYWLGLLCFLALVLLSLVRIVVGPLNLTPALAALGIAIGVALVVLRRQAIGGLEFAVYWFGLTLFFLCPGHRPRHQHLLPHDGARRLFRSHAASRARHPDFERDGIGAGNSGMAQPPPDQAGGRGVSARHRLLALCAAAPGLRCKCGSADRPIAKPIDKLLPAS